MQIRDRPRPTGDAIVRFLTGRKAREAEDAAARAEGVVEVLKLSQADLGPAEQLLKRARELAHAGDYRNAAATALRAETLAATLEERYRDAQQVAVSAEGVLRRMQAYGIATSQLDAAIAEARNCTTGTEIEDGVAVPNYLEARIVLERATSQALATVEQFEAAGSAIFVAGLAIDALRESHGEDIDSVLFHQMLVRPAEAVFERATEALATFHPADAIATAKAAEEMALRAHGDYMEAGSARAATDRLLGELRGEGAIVLTAERLLEQGANLLQRGRVIEAKEMLTRAEREAVTIGSDFRRARDAIGHLRAKEAQAIVGDDVIESFRDADRALHGGLYRRALELVEEIREASARRESVQETLVGQIRATRTKVEELKAAKADYADDLEEVLGRAEQELARGNFSACFEDLRIVSLLIGPKSLEPRGEAAQGTKEEIRR